ncbi:MAG TPA: hypothetical protein VG148_13085 [Pyrinomonadaceae bacterium]|nr:hypothetical protein [Pyrinomonadaceae bacterium]
MHSLNTRRTLLAAVLISLSLAADASAQSCPVSGTFNGSIGAGDLAQVGRMAQFDPPSDCGGPKPYPGTVDALPRRFDQYNFTNTSAALACVRVTVNPSGCGGNEIHSAAYLGSFNPADVSQNYLGDSGAQDDPTLPFSYSFNVPAGASFAVVVHETDAGTGCAAYTMTVDCGTPGAGAGQVLISEFRLSGPGAATGDGTDPRDEFIELFNTTGAPILVGRYVIRAHDPAFGDFEFPIPPGTTIPAFGRLLIGDSAGYSLSGYATLDIDTLAFFDGDVFIDNEGFQLVGPPGNNIVVDSVGFAGGGNAAQYVEGAGLTRRSSTPDVQYSYVRKPNVGGHRDTNNNAADFEIVSVTGETFAEAGPTQLGAPGPHNLASPRPLGGVQIFLLDPTKPASSEPNRVRNLNPVPNGPLGTLSVQRRITNNTASPVTRLRFRFFDITTLNTPGYTPGGPQADLRVLSSSGVVTRTDGSVVVTVQGTTLEQPPDQPNGGGYNSTVAAGTVTLSNPLMPGASIDLQFLAGVVQGGSFRFIVVVEQVQ